jgi:hypothetical protein
LRANDLVLSATHVRRIESGGEFCAGIFVDQSSRRDM